MLECLIYRRCLERPHILVLNAQVLSALLANLILHSGIDWGQHSRWTLSVPKFVGIKICRTVADRSREATADKKVRWPGGNVVLKVACAARKNGHVICLAEATIWSALMLFQQT